MKSKEDTSALRWWDSNQYHLINGKMKSLQEIQNRKDSPDIPEVLLVKSREEVRNKSSKDRITFLIVTVWNTEQITEGENIGIWLARYGWQEKEY